MSAAPSRFISFEGSEACGKTTQIALLKERLEARGERVLVTREPGGTLLGEKLRELLKHDPAGKGMENETELLLFVASRAELVRKVIAPALAEGKWVLSDRFIDSTVVYQGLVRGLDQRLIQTLNAFAIGDTTPGLTLFLSLSPEEARERMRQRSLFSGEALDRIEQEGFRFFELVQAGFTHLAAGEPNRIQLVNGGLTPDEVAEAVWKRITHAFHL